MKRLARETSTADGIARRRRLLLFYMLISNHHRCVVVQAKKTRVKSMPVNGQPLPLGPSDHHDMMSRSPEHLLFLPSANVKLADFCPVTNDSNTMLEKDFLAQLEQMVRDSEEIIHDATSKLEYAIERQEERFVKPLFEAFVFLLFFQPPVGLVMLICLFRLVGKGRLFRKYPVPENSIDVALERRKRAVKQSYTIDQDDVNYQLYGGVEHVRLHLCHAALVVTSSYRDSGRDGQSDKLLRILSDALAVSTNPDGSRLQLLRDINHAMSKVEMGMAAALSSSSSSSQSGGDVREKRTMEVATIVTTSLQLHQMDALVRLCRDQTITAAHRLAGTKEYWERRVKSRWRVLWFGTATVTDDRARLAYAHAAYQAEIERLGRLVRLLRKRPKDLPISVLIEAFKEVEGLPRKASRRRSSVMNRRAQQNNTMGILGRIYAYIVSFDLASYSFIWQSEERELFSLKSFDQARIDDRVAYTLLATHGHNDPTWRESSMAWLTESRQCISDVVRRAADGSTSTSMDDKEFSEAQIQDVWNLSTRANHAMEVEYVWNVVIDTVIGLSMWRRVGDGKVLSAKESAIVVGFRRRFDLFGIPSTFLFIWLAYWFHRWAMPRWPEFRAMVLSFLERIYHIFDRRVSRPLVGLYKEIMNENKGVTAGFALKRESVSLDHMLRDIGYGNGRPSTRGEALKKAQFAYTLALRSGVMRNLVTGKLIRLLLIQIQQLKVVALSAVGRIDVILKGNQLNFRILAAVPAIVGAIYLLRFLWRILYNIRSQDLRPVTAAHQDMAIFLEKIERGILCMDEDDKDSSTGEIVLYIHRYLLLLDFSTPPFPTKISDEIAESLHSLDARVSSKEDQRLLLRRIQRMHQQLGETL